MMWAERLDEYGRAGWIAATVLAFIVWWPLGLASLIFMFATRRMRGYGPAGSGRWYNTGDQARRGPWGAGGCGWGRRQAPQSGNAAFDEYRAETLRRLEEEQREFVEYLERLRRARDKAEFDQFMAERRRGPTPPPEAPQAA
jgi:hypothetical protein